jgi:glutathione peroxidase
MTTQQSILKFLYPIILFLDKLFPAKDAFLVNPNYTRPLIPVYDIQVSANDNSQFSLEQYKGKKILIVNTASNCGYTAQYDELELLYKQQQDGLIIIAFPSNNFKGQEPENDTTIGEFCKINYGVTFPIMKKSDVIKGNNQNEIYQWLTDANKNGWCSKQPSWNFCKYLINEEGVLTHFFRQGVSPLDKRVLAAIEQ